MSTKQEFSMNHYGESLESHPDFLFMKKLYYEDINNLDLCGESVTFETPLLENIPEDFTPAIDIKANNLTDKLNLIVEVKLTKVNEEDIL